MPVYLTARQAQLLADLCLERAEAHAGHARDTADPGAMNFHRETEAIWRSLHKTFNDHTRTPKQWRRRED